MACCRKHDVVGILRLNIELRIKPLNGLKLRNKKF